MANDPDTDAKSDNADAPLLGFLALLSTGGAGIAWLEALDFDPCNTILTKGGAGCIQPGSGGLIVGALIALFGAAILWGAVKGREDAQAPVFLRFCVGWFGLMVAACGGAIAFAQASVGV